jgi:hypothetical protein
MIRHLSHKHMLLEVQQLLTVLTVLVFVRVCFLELMVGY